MLRANDVRRSLAAAELARGKKFLAQEAWDAAEQALRHAAALAPDQAEPHLRLGNCLAAQQRWEDAAAFLECCRRRFPAVAAFTAQLGAVLAESGDAQAAVRELATIADQPEADPRWLRWYAGALVKAGARAEALSAVARLVSRAPGDPKARQAAGLISLEYGLVEQAVAHLTAALEAEPSGDRLVWLARALVQAGRPEEALDYARAAVERQPERDSTHAALAEVLLALDRVEEARESATTAVALGSQNAHLYVLLARTYDAVGWYTESRRLLQEFLRQSADDPGALHAVIGYFGKVGDALQALALAQRLVAQQPTSESFNLLADYLQRLKRFDESIDALHRAIDLDPSAAGPLATLASIFARQLRLPDAVRQWEAALVLRPGRRRWRLKAAALLLDLCQIEQAQQHIRVLLDADEEDMSARGLLARALLLDRRPDEAAPYVNHEALEPSEVFDFFRSYLDAGYDTQAFSYLADRHRRILGDVAALGQSPRAPARP